MFLNDLAISWHLPGDSGDYLAIDSNDTKRKQQSGLT